MTIGKPKAFRATAFGATHGAIQRIKRFTRAARDLVFPPCCLLCRGGVESDGASLCPYCREHITRQRDEERCPRCAAAVAPYEMSDGRCRQCRRRRLSVKATACVGPYGPHLGFLVRAYKYHGREELEPLLSDWLVEAVLDAPWLDRVEAIVSVPTHWKHRLGRPLYPAVILARGLSRKTGRPHVPILRRVRAGPHQVGLSYRERPANVRGAFAIAPGVKLRDPRLLLVDDVRTTGATIEECAKVLRSAGASEVYTAILAKAGFTAGVDRLPTTI